MFSAIQIGSYWKIQDRRQIKNTDTKTETNTETKHNIQKSNDANQTQQKTNLV